MQPSQIISLFEEAKKLFARENLLIEFQEHSKEEKIFIIGDIHGSWESLQAIINEIERNNPKKIIFLGDLVDRGPNQLKCLVMTLLLKIVQPERFYLLRGNHETLEMNESYGFYGEFMEKFHHTSGLEKLLELYDALPYCALINDKILCLHGGIPEDKNTINEMREMRHREVKNLADEHFEESLFEILWNDPKEGLGYFSQSFRGPGIKIFGRDAFEEFMEFNGFEYIIRAHECFSEGYRWFFDKRLLTIFSAANYRGPSFNPASYAIIKDNDIQVGLISV